MRVAGRFPGSTMGLQLPHCHSARRSGSPCHAECKVCLQLGALRLYRCQRCGCVVLICGRCDRGQRYCASGCAHEARQACLRRAGKRYQQSSKGRRRHAARQQGHRHRQKQKVTHQGPPGENGSVLPCAAGASTLPEPEEPDVAIPLASVQPAAMEQSVAAAMEPDAALPPATVPAQTPSSQQQSCHFCQCTRSRYFRRDSVSQLRRRLAQRAAARRSQSRAKPRSPP